MNNDVLIMLLLLLAKHVLADYFLQKPWNDKGIYGSRGGIEHAIIHAIGTVMVMNFFVHPAWAVIIAFLDGIAHYHIDWAKTNIKSQYKLKKNQTLYWGLHGVDQYLHILTYILIVYTVGG
jgi:hypothetical protein